MRRISSRRFIKKKEKNRDDDLFVSTHYIGARGIVSLHRHGASWHFTARHGAAGAPRCATWYMVRTGQRAVHVASLMEAFIGHLIRSISLLMPAIFLLHLSSHRRAPTFFFSHPREGPYLHPALSFSLLFSKLIFFNFDEENPLLA